MQILWPKHTGYFGSECTLQRSRKPPEIKIEKKLRLNHVFNLQKDMNIMSIYESSICFQFKYLKGFQLMLNKGCVWSVGSRLYILKGLPE